MLSQYTFLYVEDDALSRQVMSLILGPVIDVRQLTIFEDSSDFMSRLHALPKKPDMILLDIRLTPIDGYQLCDMIRADVAYIGVKIIALTGSVMGEDFDALRTRGFDAAIAKPFSVSTFPDLLARVARGEIVWHRTYN